MNKYFEIFEDFCDPHKKYTFSVTKNEFLIYVFSVERIDILEDLDRINSLAKKYSLPDF